MSVVAGVTPGTTVSAGVVGASAGPAVAVPARTSVATRQAGRAVRPAGTLSSVRAARGLSAVATRSAHATSAAITPGTTGSTIPGEGITGSAGTAVSCVTSGASYATIAARTCLPRRETDRAGGPTIPPGTATAAGAAGATVTSGTT